MFSDSLAYGLGRFWFSGRRILYRALRTLVLAPIVLGVVLEAIIPLLPFFGWELVNNIAIRIEDVGTFAKKKIEYLAHAENIADFIRPVKRLIGS